MTSKMHRCVWDLPTDPQELTTFSQRLQENVPDIVCLKLLLFPRRETNYIHVVLLRHNFTNNMLKVFMSITLATELSFQHCDFDHVATGHFVQMLDRCRSLRKLNMVQNTLTCFGSRTEICKILSMTTNMRVPCLQLQFVTHEGKARLASYIATTIHLRQLEIQTYTYFMCPWTIVRALRQNGSITHVRFFKHYQSVGLSMIGGFCERNQQLPQLLTKSCGNDSASSDLDNVGRSLVPTLFFAALPMHRMAPNNILIGLLALNGDGHATP
jgi:hypothetical protein